jgi:hypothetical protein
MLLARAARTPLLLQRRVAAAGETARVCVALAWNGEASVTRHRSFATAASQPPRPPVPHADKKEANGTRRFKGDAKKERNIAAGGRGLRAEPSGEWRSKKKRTDRKDQSKRSVPPGDKQLHQSITKPDQRDTAASSDAWRRPFEEFERRVHVHGAEASYTPDDVFAIVQACVDHGRHREAQTVVRKARGMGLSPTPETQALLSAIHARKGNVDLAFDTLREVLTTTGHRRDARLFDPLLSVLKDQSDWQGVRRAVKLMHDHEIEPPVRVFRVLLIAAGKARNAEIVRKTITFIETKFRDEPVDIATLTAMCQALVAVGETRDVLDRYHTMNQDWLETHGNTILFNNFVLAALRGGRITKALEIFDRMTVSETFAPDDFTFATCILELEKRGEWDHVVRFFNAMLEREMKGISQANAINALSCAAVVRALHSGERDGGRSPHATKREMRVVLQRLDRLELTHFGHVASLVDALETHGFRAEAQRLFTRMAQQKDVSKTAWLRQDGYEVDLHSFSRGVAKCAVVFAFQQIRARAAVQRVDDVRIITGVGKRSKAFLQPVVPDDVSELLQRSFRPVIRPMTHPTNAGVLLVRSKFVREWLAGSAEIRQFE